MFQADSTLVPELAHWKIQRISFYLLRKVEKSCLKNDKKSNPLVVLVVPAIMILLRVALVRLWIFFNSGSKPVRFLNKYRHAQRKSLYYLDRGSLQIMSACSVGPPRMFGLGCFWLETKVIIKILTHPC